MTTTSTTSISTTVTTTTPADTRRVVSSSASSVSPRSCTCNYGTDSEICRCIPVDLRHIFIGQQTPEEGWFEQNWTYWFQHQFQYNPPYPDWVYEAFPHFTRAGLQREIRGWQTNQEWDRLRGGVDTLFQTPRRVNTVWHQANRGPEVTPSESGQLNRLFTAVTSAPTTVVRASGTTPTIQVQDDDDDVVSIDLTIDDQPQQQPQQPRQPREDLQPEAATEGGFADADGTLRRLVLLSPSALSQELEQLPLAQLGELKRLQDLLIQRGPVVGDSPSASVVDEREPQGHPIVPTSTDKGKGKGKGTKKRVVTTEASTTNGSVGIYPIQANEQTDRRVVRSNPVDSPLSASGQAAIARETGARGNSASLEGGSGANIPASAPTVTPSRYRLNEQQLQQQQQQLQDFRDGEPAEGPSILNLMNTVALNLREDISHGLVENRRGESAAVAEERYRQLREELDQLTAATHTHQEIQRRQERPAPLEISGNNRQPEEVDLPSYEESERQHRSTRSEGREKAPRSRTSTPREVQEEPSRSAPKSRAGSPEIPRPRTPDREVPRPTRSRTPALAEVVSRPRTPAREVTRSRHQSEAAALTPIQGPRTPSPAERRERDCRPKSPKRHRGEESYRGGHQRHWQHWHPRNWNHQQHRLQQQASYQYGPTPIWHSRGRRGRESLGAVEGRESPPRMTEEEIAERRLAREERHALQPPRSILRSTVTIQPSPPFEEVRNIDEGSVTDSAEDDRE